MAETNLDWKHMKKEDMLQFHTKEWWNEVHISFSHNINNSLLTPHQFGGTAIFSIDKTTHRVIERGAYPSKLGRWNWTRFRGWNNQTLRIILGYRPNPPNGPFTVYSQHILYLNSVDDHRCARVTFIEDLCRDITVFVEQGGNIILLIDSNSNMKHNDLRSAFEKCCLREVLLEKHGLNGPSTFRRNNNRVPIDGIWAT